MKIYDKMTIIVNNAQNTIFLSKPISLSEYSFVGSEVDGFVGRAEDLREILERFSDYDVVIVSPTEMKQLLRSWGLYGKGWKG